MESNTLKIARVTGDPTAAWKSEDAQATASEMTLDSVDLTARTLMSIVKASVELAEDAEGVSDVGVGRLGPSGADMVNGALSDAIQSCRKCQDCPRRYRHGLFQRNVRYY